MKCINITENNLIIKNILNVIKTFIPASKNIMVRGRKSDAFIYIISGSCKYEFDDSKSFTVNSGDILYLANNSNYKMYVGDKEYKFIYCDFEFYCQENRKSTLITPKDIFKAENLFKKLYKINSKPNINTFFESMSYLYQIYEIIVLTNDINYVGKSQKEKIEASIIYINNNFSSPDISISKLAEFSQMSEVYYRKIFKMMKNITPNKYITNLRIQKAKELLEYGFIGIEECAINCGFASQQYFCRVFKNHTGYTPFEYKTEILNLKGSL